jgi:hypothetical protein
VQCGEVDDLGPRVGVDNERRVGRFIEVNKSHLNKQSVVDPRSSRTTIGPVAVSERASGCTVQDVNSGRERVASTRHVRAVAQHKMRARIS